MINFESVGWSRILNNERDLDAVEDQLLEAGVAVRSYDLAPYAKRFASFLDHPAYRGEYQSYGGTNEHCLIEKALEHFISFEFAQPARGMLGIDVGSCRSVAPEILREQFHSQCYEQDLEYEHGIHGNKIGSSADAIPLSDRSVDFMTLHCTFEHFEGRADSGFVSECARLLKPGGRAVILPLYLNANFCNVSGEIDPARRAKIVFDPEATYHCLIPEWANRFGRHYSPSSLLSRVINPAIEKGLSCAMYRVKNWQVIHPMLWLRWIGVLSAA